MGSKVENVWSKIIGTLRKYDGNGNKNATKPAKGLMSKTMRAVHVRYKLCTFFSRPLQNNSVK